MKLRIINRSDWSEAFVSVVCRWVAREAGIQGKYTIILPSYSNKRDRAGRGGLYRQRSRINRRFIPSTVHKRPDGNTTPFPYLETYHRYAWASRFQINNRLEAFVHLIAHECGHADGNVGDPRRFRGDAQSMEMACERLAGSVTIAFRDAWPDLKRKVIARMREERQQKTMRIASVPSIKLNKAQALLDKWQRKVKAAQNRVKKYARQVKYYNGRVAASAGK
jgi:hypothetical protein